MTTTHRDTHLLLSHLSPRFLSPGLCKVLVGLVLVGLVGCADGGLRFAVGDGGLPPDGSLAIDGAVTVEVDGGVRSETDAPEAAPVPRSPCAGGRCWTGPSLAGSCGARTLREDFGSGRYNTHRVVITARAGLPLELTLEVTGGSFEPALVLLSPDGETRYDGEVGVAGPELEIVPLDPGHSSRSASVRVITTTDVELHAYVSSWSVVSSGFSADMPLDASYALTAQSECPVGATLCPIAPQSITSFGSGFFRTTDSSDPSSPSFTPYKRDSRREHQGYDVYAPLGTPLLAVEGGTIVSAVTAPSSDDLCGRSVNLAGDSGVTYRYCHLDRVDVTSGPVSVGQQVGVVGATGNAHDEHLHFVYFDAPAVVGIGSAYRSDLVNGFIDSHCM